MKTLSRYVVASPSFTDGVGGERKRVVFSTRTGRCVLIGEATWNGLQELCFDRVSRTSLQTLVDARILVELSSDELSEVLLENRQAITHDSSLYVVVQASPDCSMQCGYCGQSHRKEALSDETADSIAGLVEARLESSPGRYQKLEIGWFGGEPLLGLRAIRDLTRRFQHLARTHGISYSAKMPTNGLALSPELGLELSQSLGVTRLEITLDGLGSVHDQRRPLRGGKPNFEVVYSNLKHFALRAGDSVHIVVRCNVDRHNACHVDSLIERLHQDGLNDQVSFYVAPVHSWGNAADKDGLTTEELREWDVHWLRKLIDLGFRIDVLPTRRPIVCLSVRDDAEVIDHRGNRYSCTEVPYVDSYGDPNRHAIGTVFEPTKSLARPFSDINARIGRGELQCSACNILPVCGGACPKLWEEGKVPCPPVKFSIEERLLLHALQERTTPRRK